MSRRAIACERLFQQPTVSGSVTPIDFVAYRAVIPEEQHTAVGKESGETAHRERWNTTLRQRLARFVRKTLSFSKSMGMHTICLNLFLHRYNLERVTAFLNRYPSSRLSGEVE